MHLRDRVLLPALTLLLAGGPVRAGEPPFTAAADPAVEEFLQKAEKEIRRLDRITLRWLKAQAPEATRTITFLGSNALERAVPRGRRVHFGAGSLNGTVETPADPVLAEWWKSAKLPADLGSPAWWKSAQSTLEGIRLRRDLTDRAAWGPSYGVFDGRRNTEYRVQLPPTKGWSAVVGGGSFTTFAEALMPAYYLRTGESVVENIRRLRDSRLLRTKFGGTAVVSTWEGRGGQFLLLRADGRPVVEECGTWNNMAPEAFIDRLGKAWTVEETRAWPELVAHERVLGWIESEGFPPIPETIAWRSEAAGARAPPSSGGRSLGAIRTIYIAPLDAAVKFDGIPSELEGQTIDFMDVDAKTLDRHHPDGRVERLAEGWGGK